MGKPSLLIGDIEDLYFGRIPIDNARKSDLIDADHMDTLHENDSDNFRQ